MGKRTAVVFHEYYDHKAEVKGGSERAFGLMWAFIAGAVAAYQCLHGVWIAGIFFALLGIECAVLGLFYPRTLTGLNRAWMKLGILMSAIINPLIMLLLYIVAIVPTGLIRRALGHDPLRLTSDPDASTYWIARTPPGPARDSMPRSF